MEQEEHEGFDYDFDLDAGVAIHRDGFCAPIVLMHDEFGEVTHDHEDAAVIFFRMPPEGQILGFNLKDFNDQVEAQIEYESEH